MADVLCDTSFLIHYVGTRVKNESRLDTDIGPMRFIVPEIVLEELRHLSGNRAKGAAARAALLMAEKLPSISLDGSSADDAITHRIAASGGIAATMDAGLKRRIKDAGGSVISFASDYIVME